MLTAKSGAGITTPVRYVRAHYLNAVTFTGVRANGEKDAAPTTGLTLQFDRDIAGLPAADITLSPSGYDAQKGTPSKTGTGAYLLPVNGINTEETLAVTVTKSGHTVTPASQTAQTHIGKPAMTITAAGGSGVTTSELALAFDKNIPLSLGDVTITDAGGTGVQAAWLSGNGRDYTLGLKNVARAER